MYRKVYLDFQDGGGFIDASSYVKYDTLSVELRAFSENWHYAQNTASFSMIYDASIFPALCNTTKEIIVRIVDVWDYSIITTEYDYFLTTENGFYLVTESGGFEPFFYGRIPATKSRTFNGIIDNTIIDLEATDELSLLKVKAGDICYRNYDIMNPADKAHSIVHQLAYLAGMVDAQIDNTVTIAVELEAYTPPSPEDTILDILDTLLFEYGYTLNMNTAGQISPIKWMRGGETPVAEFNESNIAISVSVTDALRSYDGAEVIYYELKQAAEASGDNNILLYQDSNLPRNSVGELTGYAIYAGTRYPPSANVIDETTGAYQIVYQDYDDKALKYWTNEAIVKRLDYNYKAFESDYSAIVATWDWVLEYRTDAGIVLTSAVYENRRASIVFTNPTGDSGLRIYRLDVYGKVLYKSSERKTLVQNVVDSDVNLDRYVSTYLFDKANADTLVKYLAQQHEAGDKYFKFQSEDLQAVGNLVRVVFNDGSVSTVAGVDTYGIVTERTYNEARQVYGYTVKAYSTAALPALTSQEVHEIPNVQANLGAVNAGTVIPNIIASTTPTYLGRYNHAHPADPANGTWWTVYHTDNTAPQRGVWWNNNGTYQRITTASATAVQAKFVEALTDVAWAEAQGAYGVAADYGIATLFQTLGVVTAFIDTLIVKRLDVVDTSNRHIQISNDTGILATDNAGNIIHDIPANQLATNMIYGGHCFWIDRPASPSSVGTPLSWTTLQLPQTFSDAKIFLVQIDATYYSPTAADIIHPVLSIHIRPTGSGLAYTQASSVGNWQINLNSTPKKYSQIDVKGMLLVRANTSQQIDAYVYASGDAGTKVLNCTIYPMAIFR